MLKERGDKSYNTKGVNREHKEETMEAAADEAMQEEVPSQIVNLVNNILDLFFPMLRFTSTISKITNRIISMRTNHICNNLREPSMNKVEFCFGKSLTMHNVLFRLWAHLLLNHLFTRQAKCVCRPHIFKLDGKLGHDNSCSREFPLPNVKVGLLLVGVTPAFYMITDNHIVCL